MTDDFATSSGQSPASPTQHPTGVNPPRPLKLLPPSIWPFITSIGLAACFWGFVTDTIVICVGFAVFLIGIGGLVSDWVREHNEPA